MHVLLLVCIVLHPEIFDIFTSTLFFFFFLSKSVRNLLFPKREGVFVSYILPGIIHGKGKKHQAVPVNYKVRRSIDQYNEFKVDPVLKLSNFSGQLAACIPTYTWSLIILEPSKEQRAAEGTSSSSRQRVLLPPPHRFTTKTSRVSLHNALSIVCCTTF